MNHTSIANGAALAVPQNVVAANIGERTDPRAVLADRVDQLYGQMWLGILTTFAIGAIATFEFWEVRLRELVLFWWSLVLLITAASAGLLYSYRRSADRSYPEVVRIDDVVREAMVLNKAFGERFKVRFEVDGELKAREVVADHKRLLQVMTNLLSNAAKFSPEGDAVKIAMTENGSNVRIAVQDRGPGIPEAFRSRIFGRFAQADSTASRQKRGTGLGLAIRKRLVEMMQGKIAFEDRPGGGTTFWFELPCN